MKLFVMIVVFAVVVAGVFIFTDLGSSDGNPSFGDSIVAAAKRRSVRSAPDLFRDADGDNYGNAAEPFRLPPGGVINPSDKWVANSSDCNDRDPSVFQLISKLGKDNDMDRYYTGSLRSVCVGNGLFDGFAVWYSVGRNSYITSTTALGGGDCDDADPKKYPGHGC